MKIAVAMSGGVDSSTAAYLLKSQGHDVIGLSMQMYDNLSRAADTTYGGCCTIDDLADARRVAWRLEIPHFTLNLEANFHEKVITPFVQGYLAGTTPSPCVLCNTHVKFDLFHQKAIAIGAEKIATGHYARITNERRSLRAAQGARSREGPVVLPLRAFAGAVGRGAVSARRADEAGGARHRRGGGAVGRAQEGVVRDLLRAGEGRLREDRRARGGHPARRRRRARSSTSTATSSARTTATTSFTIGQRRGLDLGGSRGAHVRRRRESVHEARRRRTGVGAGEGRADRASACTGSPASRRRDRSRCRRACARAWPTSPRR